MDSNKRIAVGVESEDRLSNMPRDVIDHILAFLPIQDAARTTVLAKKWRHTWNNHPNLVIDKFTFYKISTLYPFAIINKILRERPENIIKFVLDCSLVPLFSFFFVNWWVNCVMSRGVRKLSLAFSATNITAYKLPSNFYSYQKLTHLFLTNCSFEPPQNFIFFSPELKTLYLKNITVVTTNMKHHVLQFPVLDRLAILNCSGTQFLSITSPKLRYLAVFETQNLDLSCFMGCTMLSVVALSLNKVCKNPNKDERSTLLKQLIFSLPMLSELYLDSFYLKFLGEAPAVPRGVPIVQNCLRKIILRINLADLAQVSCAMLFINHFSSLKRLEFRVSGTSHFGGEDVLKYLKAPHNFDHPFPNLEQVVIRYFKGTRPELQLIKLLLATTPCLQRMQIERRRADLIELQERYLASVLMSYPRASPTSELTYLYI